MDRITLEGIEFHGFHGVPEAERALGHRYRVTLHLELDLRPSGSADDVTLTVDYAAAARAILEVGAGPSVQLVETLAERMADRLLEQFPLVEAVELQVSKLFPPAPIPFAAGTISIRRLRA